MAIYDKTNQLMSTRGLRPENSFYAVQWSLSSDFTPGALITRVELRLSAHGLCFRDDDGALLDLTEPRALLNPVNLATLWKSETARRRLLRPGSGRPSRRPIDPRWKVVQDAAGAGTPKIRLFQARDVRRLTHWEALARCERTLLRTGQSYAALCGEPTLDTAALERITARGLRRAAGTISVRIRETWNRRFAVCNAFFASEIDAFRRAECDAGTCVKGLPVTCLGASVRGTQGSSHGVTK